METLFRYEIKIFTVSDEEITSKGIVCAKDYADAVARLISNEIGYGAENVLLVKVETMLDPILDDDELKCYLTEN